MNSKATTNTSFVNDLVADTEALEPIIMPKASLSDYEHLRITAEKIYPHSEPTIRWSGFGVAAPGNITGISAQAKAGKTAFTSVLIAGSVSQTGVIDGFEALSIAPNNEGKAVIHMDTEQSEDDQQYGLKTVLRRAGIEHTPDHYLSYNIRQLSIGDYQTTTDSICASAAEQFGGIQMIVIDGGADYILSVNDEASAVSIVEYYTHLAIRYNCPVIVVVHLNPGSDKERGHFGSQIQRKCYGLIGIKKEGEMSIAEAKRLRKGAESEVAPISFKYDTEKGYHIETDRVCKDRNGDEQYHAKMLKIADTVFEPLKSFRHNDAVREIMKASFAKSDRTAKDYLKYMEAHELVIKTDDYYRRVIRGNSG